MNSTWAPISTSCFVNRWESDVDASRMIGKDGNPHSAFLSLAGRMGSPRRSLAALPKSESRVRVPKAGRGGPAPSQGRGGGGPAPSQGPFGTRPQLSPAPADKSGGEA